MPNAVSESRPAGDGDGGRQRPPGNVYYVMPYYGLFFLLYAFIGTFCCGWFSEFSEFSDSLSTSASAMLWTSYVVSYAVLILIHPKVCVEDKRLNEEGTEVLVRWPLAGFKACEVLADLERTRNGLCDKGDRTDLRLHNGYRYRNALVRI